MKKQHLRQSSDDDEEAPSSRQHDDDMTTENESGSNYDSALRQKKHQKEAEQHCTSSSQDDIMEKKVDLEDGSEMVAAAHNDAPQDSRNDDSRRPGNDIQINPTVDGYGIPIGVPGAYRVTPRGSTNDATALHHRDDGFPGQVFFVPGEPLLRPQRDVVEELDRLGVPTIICDALPTEVNDDNNIDDDNHHDEENIPSAEVSHAQVAEPLNTSSVCCLHKEVNRGTAKWIISSLSLVVLVSIASVVAIFINQRKDDTIFDAEDNMKSSILDEEANIKYIQELVSTLSSHEVLQDPSSPQSKAVAWMVGQPDLNFIHIQGFDVESRVKERYAMAVFYFSTNGENWTRNEQYLARSPICAWDASIIKCHPMIMEEDGEVMDTSRFSMRWGGRVVELNLENNNLHGSIPSEIHHMYYLKNINLSKNPQLGGQVPREIESLSHLEGLSIRSTIVIGSIEFLCTNNNARNLQSSYYTVDHEEGLLSTTSCPKGHCWEADLSRVECSCCD